MATAGVVQRIAGHLLKAGLVNEILALGKGLDPWDLVPIVVTDEKEADRIVVCSLYPYSLARLYRDYGKKGHKVGLVVRSCDARALVELAKRNQLKREDLFLIGIECHGTIRTRSNSKAPPPLESFMESGAEGAVPEDEWTPNCRRCEYPVPVMADVSCRVGEKETLVAAFTERGKEVLKSMGIESSSEGKESAKASRARAKRWQEKDFGSLSRMSPQERLRYWFGQFEKCIKCFGCRDACPICYCKDCYLEADKIMVKGGALPPEKMFHLVRLAHVADSCLNCGQCEAACPAEIPISKLYHQLYQDLCATFHYEAGMDPEAPPPLGMITEEEITSGGVDLD